MDEHQPKTLQEIAEQSRYPLDAFHFIRHGLDYTVRRRHENPEQLPEEERHVDGAQLAEGLRDFALAQYGHMARTVLSRMRIERTEDFGHIVFAMVEGGLMQATEDDSPRDFEGLFDLDEALRTPIPVEQVPEAGFEPDYAEQS